MMSHVLHALNQNLMGRLSASTPAHICSSLHRKHLKIYNKYNFIVGCAAITLHSAIVRICFK